MSIYLGRKGQGYIQQIGYCQRCGWKYLRTQLTEDDYIKGLLVCVYCHDPDQPQRYPVEPRAEGFPPLVPAPDQYPGPLAPVLSGSYVSGNTVDLSWTPSVDNADLIEQYFVYRTFNGGPAQLIASVPYTDSYDFPNNQVEPYTSQTVYADDTVSPGQTYTYYVVADAVDNRESPPSNVITIFTQPPPPVLSGFFNYTTNQVDLSWTLPSSWTPFVTNFVISRSVNGGAFSTLATVSSGSTSYIDTTATNFLNEYQYFIVAEYGATNSVDSNVITAPTIVTIEYTTSGLFVPANYPGFQRVAVIAVGGGGGAASAGILSTVFIGGGNGGGAGGLSVATFTASQVGVSPLTVTVGPGGIGGAGIHTIPNQNTGRNNGSNGGSSSFGGLLVAGGGQANNDTIGQLGAGGTGTTQNGAGTNSSGFASSGEGATSGVDSVAAFVGAPATLAPGAGGGGAVPGFDFGTAEPGSAGGEGQSSVAVPSPGGAATGQPGSNADMVHGWSGGGGGGGLTNVTAGVGQDGGHGGLYGAGGGGGGAGYSQTNNQYEGAGGNGAQGIVVVTVYS